MRPLILLSLLAGCASDSALSNGPEDRAADTGGAFAPSPGSEGANGDSGDAGAPSENEQSFVALMPASTDVYVFIANPDRDTLTRIQAATKEVVTTPVGRDPHIVLTTEDYATVAVFNRGDDSVTVLDAGTLDGLDVPVRPNMNRMVMSPDGAWVALWHDVRAERPDDPAPHGVVSFNEVSLVNLDTGTHYPMVVGFSPSDIAWTPDGTLAVVVADAYLAKIDLLAPEPVPHLVQVSTDLVNPPIAEEVALDPAGTVAFVRQFGAQDLAIVDLITDEVAYTPVGNNPTDLDISPDGSTAVIVSRGSNELYLFDMGAPFDTPTVIDMPDDGVFGSVLFDPTGTTAVLYTTAVAQDRYATWDTATDEITTRALAKPVSAMAITPTGDSLMVFHTRDDVVTNDGGPFANSWALSLIDLHDFRPNTLRLPGEPNGFVNAASGERGYLIMKNQPLLTVLDYHTLIATDVTLHSTPVWLGLMPDLDLGDGAEPPTWVSQEHRLGRVSFYDPNNGDVETLTGFELNAAIED